MYMIHNDKTSWNYFKWDEGGGCMGRGDEWGKSNQYAM
jgi:hypothetical protein